MSEKSTQDRLSKHGLPSYWDLLENYAIKKSDITRMAYYSAIIPLLDKLDEYELDAFEAKCELAGSNKSWHNIATVLKELSVEAYSLIIAVGSEGFDTEEFWDKWQKWIQKYDETIDLPGTHDFGKSGVTKENFGDRLLKSARQAAKHEEDEDAT